MIRVLSLALCALLFCACGTRREYYEPPEKLDGKLSYESRLSSRIKDTNLDYAFLKSDEVLDKNGLIKHFKLPKGYTLLKFEASEFVIADKSGNLKILDENSEEIYAHSFDAAVLSVALNGDDMALVLADNTIILINRSLGVKFSQTLTPAPAQDKRVASPHFMETIIIYPTLDGKLVVLDRATQKVIRDVVVSSEDFFNNVIFMSVVDDKMIAATPKRIVVVSPTQTYTYDEEIRNVVVSQGFIFIFAKNGNIIKTNLNLNKLVEKKLKYAIYNESSIFKGHLYVFEKTGYLFKSDLNLEHLQVFRLKGAAGEKAFMKEGKFYYDDKILSLP